MKYQNYNYTSKSEVIKILDDNKNVVETIIGAINGVDDSKWLEELCMKYILNEDLGIARTAIYGISDIARIYHKLLYRGEIEKQFSQIKDQKLKYIIQEVKDDLKIFLKEEV
jgi:hypothetical protein